MDGAQRPQFFKLLSQDCKLSIPPAFVKHNHGKAIIFFLGKFWRVKVQQDKEGLFFGDGWDEIVAAHELEKGFLLMFRYEGNMVFTLKVFDRSSFRRYHTPKKRKARTADKDTESPLNDDSGRPKRRSTNAEESMELKKMKKKKHMSSFAEKQSQLNNIKKENQFSRTISKSNVVHSYLHVPLSFCASNGFSTRREVILKVSKGKSFLVNLTSLGTSPKFSKGWRVFSEENNLKEGDTCVFELDSENKNVMHVQIKYKP